MQNLEIGVVVVVYESADVIIDCVQSLLASEGARLRIVICDNASPDESVVMLRRFAAETAIPLLELTDDESASVKQVPDTGITILRLSVNGGFAAGANAGLRLLLEEPQVGLFWVLNPDCVVARDTAAQYLRCAETTGAFALMGGRVVFMEPPHLIQADGARVNRWTGGVRCVNQRGLPDETAPPDPATLDFITGANMVASRTFLETRGPMEETYFLYYEEVEWAFRRGELPLIFCSKALVYHHGGTSIGTGTLTRRASGFANYFNFRNRMRFVARYMPWSLPGAYLYSMAKVGQILLRGSFDEAAGALLGLHQLPPPTAVRKRLSPAALQRITQK